MPSARTSPTQPRPDLRPKRDDRPYFEAEDGSRLDVMCEVIDELENQMSDGNFDRIAEGLKVIREMGIRMENKLRQNKEANG
jgi:hypothetical protein